MMCFWKRVCEREKIFKLKKKVPSGQRGWRLEELGLEATAVMETLEGRVPSGEGGG